MPRRRRSEAPLLREGPRDLRVGRRPADGRLRPDLDLRRGDADADPRQGQGAEPDVGLLVRADRGHRPQPLHLRGRARGGRRTGDAGAPAGDVPGRVRGPRLPLRLGLEGIQGERRRLRDRAARRPARVRQAAGADLHPGDQGRDRRPRREHRLRPGRRDRRRPGADGGAAAGLDRGLQARRRARGRARDHPRRHQVRVRPPRRRRDRPRRRGADPGLLALLARRPATSRAHASPPSTSSSSATGPTRAGWDKTPPAPELPADVVEQTRAKYVEAYERITERTF